MTRKIAAIITAITEDRIVIGEEELEHIIKEHFSIRNSHKGLKEIKP